VSSVSLDGGAPGQHDAHGAFAKHAFDPVFIADQRTYRHTTPSFSTMKAARHGLESWHGFWKR